MQLIKSIILSIISSLTNTLPISYSSHINLYKNLFNTDIFDNSNLISLLNISLIIAILLYLTKDILLYLKQINSIKSSIKEEKRKMKESKNKLPTPLLNNQNNLYKSHLKYIKIFILISIINSLIYFLLPKYTPSIKVVALSYLFTSLIIILSSNKNSTKNYKDLSYKTALILGLSTLFCIIPSVSPLCIYLFIFSLLHFNKKVSLNYSLIITIPILFINSIPGLIYLLNYQNYIISNIISITISTIISLELLKTLKKIYSENKLYKFSFYCLFLSIFILIWFR